MTPESPTAQSGPSVCDTTIAEHVANAAHGSRYGIDWIWHDDRLGYLLTKPSKSLPPAGARDAAIDYLLKVAKNYVRCVSDMNLSPYVRENSIRGSASPWAEFIDALEAVDRAIPAMKSLTGKADGGDADALAREERSHGLTINQRDRYHDKADALASAISDYFGVDIGEHSSANCPWDEALEVIENAKPYQATQPAAPGAGEGGAFDMAAHLQRQREWSERTFGPGPRTAGVTDHIRKELLEIEAAPTDASEWIDVVILSLDGAWRAGLLPHEIIAAIVAKQSKNEGRIWPDWRTADPNKAIEHDRTGER